MKLTNHEIYSYAQQLSALNIGDIKMPVRINFFLQKNMQVIAAAGQEIDAARTALVAQFGELNNEGTHYVVPPEKMAEDACNVCRRRNDREPENKDENGKQNERGNAYAL